MFLQFYPCEHIRFLQTLISSIYGGESFVRDRICPLLFLDRDSKSQFCTINSGKSGTVNPTSSGS